MKIKRVKQEYKGLVITRKNISLGSITLDTAKVELNQIDNYINSGFADIFEEVDVSNSQHDATPTEFIDEVSDLEKAKKEVKSYSKKPTKKPAKSKTTKKQ